MYIGVDYYPEHWDRQRWDVDAQLMQAAGFNVVRLAEFAWVNMEPVEGQFQFDWLDEALELLGAHGLSAILCTPTAVMPAWVQRKYPETLAMQPDGTRLAWGVRKNNCFSSGAYRLLSERITRAMAEHVARSPHVIGWQTDNEFGGPVCTCHSCRASFQDWLRHKYQTLEALNAAWGSHFWGHTLHTWGDMTLPIDADTHNPSACLDWKRHHTWLTVQFQRDQICILRQLCPHHFVTHNFMGLYKELDYYALAEDLDIVSWDNYPVWGKPDIPYGAACAADVMRGLKRQNFWIMEQTAGCPGWETFGRNPRPGEIRSVAYQQLAHGCDGQIWFRWRTCTAGREQYWHGLLGHDGKPLRRYREAAQTTAEYHKLADILANTTVRAEVAIIYDYESAWALAIQPGYAENTFQGAVDRYYNALFRVGVNVDMLPPGADLSPYKLVLAPALHILPDSLAERLDAYVQEGGVLLTDGRSAVKDEHNLCYERTLPGKLSAALGIRIEEYESLAPETIYPVVGHGDSMGNYTAIQYTDWVQAETAEVLMHYQPWHMKEYAAMTRQAYGRGAGWYVGTVIQETAFYDRLIARLLADADVRPLVSPPVGVEARTRQREGKTILFLINHTETAQAVEIPTGGHNLLTDGEAMSPLTLERLDVAVIAFEPVYQHG